MWLCVPLGTFLLFSGTENNTMSFENEENKHHWTGRYSESLKALIGIH